MADREKYYIGPGLRDKLRETITRVGGLSDNHAIDEIPTRLQDFAPSGGGKVFRVCEFTGTWNKGDAKTVTIKFSSAGSTSTLVATNLMFNLDNDASGTSGPRICVVGKEGTAWYFVAAGNKPPCDSMAGKEISPVGYSATINTSDLAPGDGAAALFLSNGCVEWVRTTQVTYISSIERVDESPLGFRFSENKAWVFAPISSCATTQTISLIPPTTSTTTVVTNVSLGETGLVIDRVEIVTLGATPAAASTIEVYECSTSTGTTS